jgi:hypothetical protein
MSYHFPEIGAQPVVHVDASRTAVAEPYPRGADFNPIPGT